MRTSAGLIAFGVFWFAAPTHAAAAQAELRWRPVERDMEGGPETINHYLLCCGLTARPPGVVHPSDGLFSYDRVINTGSTTQHQLADLSPGTWFFAVVAVDAEGNLSNYSSEVRLEVAGPDGSVPPAPESRARATPAPAQPPPSTGCATTRPIHPGLGLLVLGLGSGLCGRRRRRIGR